MTLGVRPLFAQENTELNTLPTPDSSLIVYLSAIHRKITPNNVNAFGATYDDAVNVYDVETDYGIITFDGNMTAIGE
ncbi:MAG: hypothetical protein MJZ56_05550 [Bacteroidales bacterium]|nr:hypothetical protein [Bacteroidales bacterium]